MSLRPSGGACYTGEMPDPTAPDPDEPNPEEVTAPADDGMAPIIANTGDDDEAPGDDADAPTG